MTLYLWGVRMVIRWDQIRSGLQHPNAHLFPVTQRNGRRKDG